MNTHSVVVHGHFYQPPREDPRTDRVLREASAAPWHDWNHRIHDECYRAVTAARVLDGEGQIAQVVNALEWMSWDAGPTLLRWMARETPGTYRAFLDADARSVARTGHGNALACPYHHVILPLASRRDKVTEVRWGMADSRRRFGREPEGMWLPEAAVDTETLEVLADHGIRFTVVGPDQVDAPPADGAPVRVALSGGREMALFVYDGGLSHEVAFGALLRDADAWAERMATPDAARKLVSLATDGETFGHHHRWADMALAAVLTTLNGRPGVHLESYAAALARMPPERTVSLVEPSAWSCAHGVDRWRAECGCRMDPSQNSSQAWRAVLRDALDELAEGLHARFEDEAGALLDDPWAARDDYGRVLDRGAEARRAFVREHASGPRSDADADRALELLEMERDALRMFTSCGWFFDDIAGLEAMQVLRYAAHALDLLGDGADALEGRLLERLETAVSNDPDEGTGRDLWMGEIRGRAPEPAAEPRTPVIVTTAATAGSGGDSEELEAEVLRAVAYLTADPADATADAVERVLDRLAAVGMPVPFAAQTDLARALGPHAHPGLRRVARRMGLSPEGVASGGVARPVRFVFGLHVHQPVGNFDEVFERHVEDVYLPFLERAEERGLLPLVLHVSGPLLEWMEERGHPYLDRVGRLVADGQVELLLSGFYEPVLASLPRPDRVEQIGWMRDWIARHMGADATGLWLTERVWEPGLVEDLAAAGVAYTLVDDRHFLVAGFRRDQLHRPWRTESGGHGLSLLPIDERLRYLIPFRPPEEIGGYLESLASAGHPLAVLADDGEKFGGWPGTADWVWTQGWMDRFLDEVERLTERGVVRLSTGRDAVEAVEAGGLAYLPSASYREMEGWSLPPDGARRLHRLEARTADDPQAAALVRGGHWRNFVARYPESNRMHKKATALSALCRERGDPDDARRAVGRAQCNDAYWHGVFGGLYLRHLRNAIWRELARAESLLRAGQPLEAEVADVYGDGQRDVRIHGARVSAVVRPGRGGSLTELTWLDAGVNLADVLTRRREAYHDPDDAPDDDAPPPAASTPDDDGADPEQEGMASIHDLEENVRFEEQPPFDLEERALFVDRVLPAGLEPEAYARGESAAVFSWASQAFSVSSVDAADDVATVVLEAGGPGSLSKSIAVHASGRVAVSYRWDPAAFPTDARFAVELSLGHEARVSGTPPPADTWRYDIVTVSRSEAGAETSVQGHATTLLWPCAAGRAEIEVARPTDEVTSG
ncbi:MAG: DUF1926 domain-containing protein [Longimicrobiales bacterium]